MSEFTPDRLAEMRAVAVAATRGPWESEVVLDDEGFTERVSVGAGTWIESGGANYRSADLIFETDTYGWDEDDCQQAADNARHVRTFDPPTMLSLIATLEDKTDMVDWLREIGKGLLKQRDEARTEAEEMRAWQAQTIRRVRDTVASEHYAMLVVEDIPNADFGELIDTLVKQRDEARTEAEDARKYRTLPPGYVWQDYYSPDEVTVIRWEVESAIKTAERERDEARATIEWVRIAATEVTNQGDNHGATHYEGCWKHHLHCLAAKIIYETGEDDE